MNTATQRGYLVLADITGFTPFVAETELDHSREILNEILKGVLSYLTPRFTLAEVEGDALFVYAPSKQFPRGDGIIEILESSYFAFRDRKGALQRIKTCNCKACQMAPLLDLKFVVHYGEYIMNSVSGKKKPMGGSVNVAHRLLKNNVSDATGWNAYMLLTRDFVDVISINPTKYHREVQRYDHIGAVETFSINLEESYRKVVEERVVFLSREQADVVVERDFSLPPALLWEWIADPIQRTRWSLASDWKIGLRPLGRMGRGATNHCVNSKVMETILDYRPFDYYTSSMTRGMFRMTLTSAFKDIPSGTRLSWHLKINSILPKVISRFVCRLLVEKGMRVNESFEELKRQIERDRSGVDVLVS